MTANMQRGRSNTSLIVLVGVGVLFLIAFGLRGCWLSIPGMEGLRSPLFSGWNFFGYGHYGLLWMGGLIQIGLAIWVGVDAHRKGLNGFLWGLLVFFTFIVGLVVYMLVGTSLARGNGRAAAPAPAATPAAVCPACAKPVQREFKVCPYCGVSLRCPKCEGPVESGWKVCPSCAEPL